MTEETIVWAGMKSRIGTIRVAATSRGICKIALGQETAADFFGWLKRRIGDAPRRPERSGIVALALDQIVEYLNGTRREFDLPLDLRGTEFQRSAWSAVAGIPYGQTRTYTQIAQTIGKPLAVRAVGAANSADLPPSPCHRVLAPIASTMAVGWMWQRLLEMGVIGGLSAAAARTNPPGRFFIPPASRRRPRA
jgi:AraC family transcriptional regulator of adaptative response/methylated-DNA-[protein]-cysteine methyltransferase